MSDESTESALRELGERIRTQDNLCTGLPIFMVQRRFRDYRADVEYFEDDHIVWRHQDGPVADIAEAERLERLRIEGDDIPEEWERMAFVDRWEAVMPFFTRVGADQYIAANKHNLTPEARVYVESGYRNPEWEAIRGFLASLPAPGDALAALLAKGTP